MKYKYRRELVIAIIVLFILTSVIPSTGRVMLYDDKTPPVTTCTLDPPEPDGENGWYVSDVNVTLNATDDMSGVKEIRYWVEGDSFTILGSYGTFNITDDGDDILIEYYAIDNAGNIESINSFTVDLDQTMPVIDPDGVHFEAFQTEPFGRWFVRFWTNATDATSGMDRVVMYINEGVHEINSSPSGARYDFVIMWSPAFESVTFRWEHYDIAGNMVEDEIVTNPWWWHIPHSHIIGLICNPKVVNQHVTFFAILVKYNVPSSHGWHTATFEHFTIPNDYWGYIGRHIICVDL